MLVVCFALAWWVSMRLDFFGQPSGVTARTTVYFRILMASIVPGLVSIALKNHADALNRPWSPFWIFLGGVGLNVFLNWVMIYGNLGSKALGFEGAAWATLISRSAILVVMLVWLTRTKGLAEWVPDDWFKPPVFDEIRRLLSIGMPASVQMLFEVSAFSVAGLWMGLFGPVAMASHQIAITLAGTAFMIPLGLSMALTVRIGTADGAGERDRLRPIMFSGWFLVAGNALLVGTSFMVFGRWITSLFTNDPEVIALSASLLVIVGIFQVVDGLQVASASMLRGLHDARVPALIGLVSYWLIGLPVSGWLAFTFGVGACGVWWGLAVGLGLACMTLGPRLWRQVSRAHLGV